MNDVSNGTTTALADRSALADEAAADLAASYNLLVLTDRRGLEALEPHVDRFSRSVLMVPVVVGEALNDPIALAMLAAAGKLVVTWCSSTDDGIAVERYVVKLVKGYGVTLRHLGALKAPEAWDEWHGTGQLTALIDKSPTTPRPAKPRPKASSNGTRSAAGDSPDDDGTFDVSPLRLAERILERSEWAARCLLVTGDKGQFISLYTQHPTTGLWRDPEAAVLGWQGEIADELEREAYGMAAAKLLDPKVAASLVRAIRNIKTPDNVSKVCRSFGAAVDNLRRRGLTSCIHECTPGDLDADLRYMGVANGVVDLHEARLMTADEATSARVTVAATVPYDPDRYPTADWFLSHLPPQYREWWLDTLGFSLRGIAKRLYGCLAPPDSGKTTAINLLRRTLGAYVSSPTPGALDARVRYEASGHTPGLFAWLSPVRITIVDEVKERELSAPLVKDLTGGGWFTARDTYQTKVTKRATGTTYMFANDSAGEQPLPQLRTDDPGMNARYRELPFPPIPKAHQVENMRDKWPDDPERRAQLLTLLVQRAAANPQEPEDIPAVKTATAERIQKDAGELGAFARRFVRDGSAVLEFSMVWAEWCRHNSESPEAPVPGGIRKRDFFRRLSAYVEGLSRPVSMTVRGRKVRGWRGWRLLTVEEAEALNQREDAEVGQRGSPLLDEKLMVTFYRAEMKAQQWYELTKLQQEHETNEQYEQRHAQWKAALGRGEKMNGLTLIEKYRESGGTYLTFFADPKVSPSATADDKRAAVLIRDDERMTRTSKSYEALYQAYVETDATAYGSVESLRELSPSDWNEIYERCLGVVESLAQMPEFAPEVDLWAMNPADQFAPEALGQTLPPNTVPIVPLHGLPTTLRVETDTEEKIMKIGRWVVCRSAAPATDVGIRLWSMAIDYAWRRCTEPRPPHPLERLGANSRR